MLFFSFSAQLNAAFGTIAFGPLGAAAEGVIALSAPA